MFYKCESLKAHEVIYCNDDWSTYGKRTSSTDMFKYCVTLKGGNGTPYDVNKVNILYARPDMDGQNGYFTKDEPTGIDETNWNPEIKNQKFIKDGQLYLMYNGHIYNIQGQVVK